MPSGGDQSPPPPPPPPAAAASDEEEEDDGEAEDAAQPARSLAPQTQQRFDELCSRLNMDEAARAEAWESYRSMSESYTLEVRRGKETSGVRGLVVPPRRGGWGPFSLRLGSPAGELPRSAPQVSPPGQPRLSRSPAWSGKGVLSAHFRPGNLAFEKPLAVLKVNSVSVLFPLRFRRGNSLCPELAPRG